MTDQKLLEIYYSLSNEPLKHTMTSEEAFAHYVTPYLPSYPKVSLSPNREAEVSEFVDRIVERKLLEGGQYSEDAGSMPKRFMTGFCGECAVEEYLGKRFVDFSIGHSKTYNIPDLQSIGLEIGIKTVNLGDFPLLKIPSPSSPQTPQIIVLKEGSTYHIAGIATFEIVNERKNFHLSYVRSTSVAEREGKSAFYRFDLLSPLS